MDSEFSWGPADQSMNSISATVVTRLNKAEEARLRELLADAWDEGYAQCEGEYRGLRMRRTTGNPYRMDQ